VLLNVTAIRLDRLGLEWRNDARTGDRQQIESELYQPLDLDGLWFVTAGARHQREVFTLFDGDHAFGELERRSSGGALSAGRVLGTSGEVRLAAFRERREQRLKSGPDLAGMEGLEGAVDVAGWQLLLSLDRLDSIYFAAPLSGTRPWIPFALASRAGEALRSRPEREIPSLEQP